MQTMLSLILDRSGSMQGKEDDVIGGVNAFIIEQKMLPDEAVISLVRFDEEYEEFRPTAPLKDAKLIDAEDYQPRGSTALLDAVGRTLLALDAAWKQYQPQRAIVVIVTDGHENASHEFTLAQIKEMIEGREKSGKWAFLFLGADVNAFAEAGAMGIAAHNTAGYANTRVGTRSAYAAATASVAKMRMTGSSNAGLGGQLPEADPVQPTPAAWTTPA
jgi:uncharacterized protein YegL